MCSSDLRATALYRHALEALGQRPARGAPARARAAVGVAPLLARARAARFLAGPLANYSNLGCTAVHVD